MLFQLVAIAFAASGADVSVIDRQLPAEDCIARIERAGVEPRIVTWSNRRGKYLRITDSVLACIPDNVDF